MNRIRIRSLARRDRARIEEIVEAAGNFSHEEIATAMELVDESLEEGKKSGYFVKVAEDDKVQGYACYGPTPMTEGVYDLYWIAVHPEAQGRGVGRRLLHDVERDVGRRGGRMIVLETSSREDYAGTTRFYKREGYERVARIRNFYRIGDDKLLFAKDLK